MQLRTVLLWNSLEETTPTPYRPCYTLSREGHMLLGASVWTGERWETYETHPRPCRPDITHWVYCEGIKGEPAVLYSLNTTPKPE